MAAGAAAMRHVEGSFRGVGGLEIFWQAWVAASPRANVVLSHGAGEHSGRYAHVGAALTDRGYSLWALDHRGHGRSAGHRALIDRLENAVVDLRTFVDRVAEESPAGPPFLLGHSMGGCIATAYAIRFEETLRGLVLSGPVAALEAASPATRAASYVLTRIAPRLGVFGVNPQEVSRDPEVVRQYETDPLVFHGKLPVRTVAELAAEVATFPDYVAGVTLPVLILHGGADPIVPLRGSEMLDQRLSSPDKALKVYEGLYHEILNEPERDRVIADIADWLDAH